MRLRLFGAASSIWPAAPHRRTTGPQISVSAHQRAPTAPAAPDRVPTRRGRLIAAAWLCAVLLSLIARESTATPAAATVRPVPAATDTLLVQAAPGVALEALGRGLTRAGYELRPGAEAAGAIGVVVPAETDPARLAAAIAALGLAQAIEPDGPVQAAIVPNDLGYERQVDYLETIRVPDAWDRVTGDGSTVIAIVDSGLDYNHREFRDRIATNEADPLGNGRDDDRNGCIDDIAGCNFVSPQSADPSCNYTHAAPNWRAWDDAGHGTVVAGIAAAAGDDGLGIAGVTWNARLLPVKVLDCTAVGRISTAAAGIRYAADRGADVINISLGTSSNSPVLRAAVEHAQRSGALIVASAGNVPGVVTYPGAYPGVIAVGASGADIGAGLDYTRRAPFSGSGATVDLIAPGLMIAGPLPLALCGARGWQCEDGAYTRVSGSSFAAALVTGAAALLRAHEPTLAGPLLRAQLLRSLQPASDGGPGVLDLLAALDAPLHRSGVPGTARTSTGLPVTPTN